MRLSQDEFSATYYYLAGFRDLILLIIKPTIAPIIKNSKIGIIIIKILDITVGILRKEVNNIKGKAGITKNIQIEGVPISDLMPIDISIKNININKIKTILTPINPPFNHAFIFSLLLN